MLVTKGLSKQIRVKENAIKDASYKDKTAINSSFHIIYNR